MSERKQEFVFAKRHWDSLARRLCSPENHTVIYSKLVDIYSDSKRSYHNLRHIVSMLDALETFPKKDSDFSAIQLAIWYHDVVYDPQANNNEEQSVALCKSDLESFYLPQQVTDKVEQLILATKHTERVEDRSSKIIADLDLTVLGSKPYQYLLYEEGIRAEYCWVPDLEFNLGRRNFLENMLSRESIYQTDFFRNKLEARAKENIRLSIEKLPIPIAT